MASINLDVSLDDAKFLAFYEAFKAYGSGLDDSVAVWGSISDSVAGASQNALVLAEQAEDVKGSLFDVSKYSERVHRASDAASKAWDNLAKRSGQAASNIKEATVALLKWSGIVSIVGGLAGGAGIVGMDALGSRISAGRTGAMRAGTTIGGREALGINFSRFGNAEGVLDRVANIQNSADHTALRNLGISEDQIKNMDPADLAALAFAKLRERTQSVNKNYLGDWLQSNRVSEVFDLGQALQARGTSAGEMREVQEHYRKDRPRLEMTPKAQLGWTKFVLQLDIAGGVLKKVFAENLSHLTGGLGKLSEAFTKLLETLLKKDGPLEHWLSGLNDWLMKLGDHLASPAFEKNLADFWDGVKTLAKWTGALLRGLAKVASWFGVTPAAAATSGYGNGAGGRAEGGGGAESREHIGSGERASSKLHGRNRVLSRSSDGERALGNWEGTGDFYDSIIRAEGTGKYGDPYNTSLGYMRSPKPLTDMTMDEALAWGDKVRRAQGLNSSAKGAFQIVNTTQRAAMKALGIRGDEPFSPENQRRMADWIARKQGLGAWEGFKTHPRERARASEAMRHPAGDVGNMPANWRTKVIISKPPGGDLAAQANAAAHQ